MKLEGASVLVTGGGSGLGRATALHLAAQGAEVVAFDLNPEAGEKLLAEAGKRVHFVAGNALADEDVSAAIAAAAAIAPLRGLVACAGGAARSARTLARDGSPHERALFEGTLDLNVVTTFNALRLAAAQMATQEPDAGGERGSIVLTSSIAAYEGQIGQLAYAASKGAIVSMTLTAARDLAAVGIRVNTIAPGTMHTSAWEGHDDIRLALEAKVPFPNRLGHPREFADLAEHLMTNGYLNGTVVRLDGAIRFDPK
jgi:NAD(P)-dependent dehydrogenase (short-subunit alcohol dehydrogenase family)